jgi:glycosyltransferase involved in cell wall biosynthesis
MMNISVIIPTYNRVGMLRRALASVLAQEQCGEMEVIVVDDGSSDETLSIVARDYPQIRLLQQQHKGAPAARNLGMAHANGAYIALLDDDDEMTPGSLEVRIRALAENPDIDMVCADYQNYVNNELSGSTYFGWLNVASLAPCRLANAGVLVCADFFDAQLRYPIALTSSMMLRQSSLRNEDRFDETLLIGQDWEYALRFSMQHRVGLLPQVVAKRHCHGGNMASQKERGVVGQVLLDRKVLSWSSLSDEQRAFAKDRLDDDLYEAGYYFAKQGAHQGPALRYWWNSLKYGVSRKKIKLLIRCLLPNQPIH